VSSGRRVVITGTGVLSPLGIGKQTVWPALKEGRSGIREIAGFDTAPFQVRIAGELPGYDPEAHFDRRSARRIDLFTQYAIVAAREAVEESGLDLEKEDLTRIGSIIGTGIGGLHTIETQHLLLLEKGVDRVSPLMIPKLMCNAAAGTVSIQWGLKGPSFSVSSACASGSNAIGEAFHAIRQGHADMMVAGGSEAAVTPMGLAGFQNIKALSKRNDEPERASRPFDRGRDGFVMAEGAGIMILEELEHARKRGANILAEMLGYGASSDASHITLPDPNGRGAQDAMRATLADGGCNTDEIDYINAHGTSTPAGDDIEAKAVVSVFGERAKKIPVSSTKSMIGHLLGASGAVEGLVCVWSIQDGVVTPTINLDDPDPECCDLDFVPHESREAAVRRVMNNSFGFGGHNVGLLLGKFEG
jgi:3-oxoacyl-[acyl-carrier-protein] synthase II